MSLPKEPRQKMINMMYLVLTALLALNVSNEVLEAFKTVDTSIINSNGVIDKKNTQIYDQFKAELVDEQTKAKAAIWAPKADKVHQLSVAITTYVEGLKKSLKENSGLRIEDGKEEFKEDDLDAPTKLFIEENEGSKLYDKMADFKKQVIDVLNPNDFADNPILMADIKKTKENFDKALPVNLHVDEERIKGNSTGDAKKDWAFVNFHMTPTIAAITILSKLENDAKNTEAQMVDYLHSQIGKVKLVFDRFQPIAQSNTSYAMPGDPIEITAGVGAFSDAAKPKIYIDGQLQPITADGTALYKTNASGTGEHNVNVKIDYAKPDGKIETITKVVKYTVGVPSGASVFLEKMNVLYIGVDNPLTISGGSVGAEKTHVSFADGSISKAGGDRYIAKPSKPGISKIVVNANGKNFEFPMRLKYLPPPTGFVGSKKGGSISSAEFKAIGAVIAKLEESDFMAPFQVVSYRLGAVGGPIQLYTEAVNEGNRWSGQAASLVTRSGPGTRIFIDAINVIGPDGRKREIPGMQFSLK